ncbi:hypothetical protein [Nitrosomonas sp.]|uniref:hypothetical protein n=1 Tax=Nitrosomonas sp. TaxID=42353 RepID=UPI001DB5531F|nr:hypothetical protein [Nitrosomonas sp.]MCB1947510.1 hypothetical protein [Nitrosomonas sp.]
MKKLMTTIIILNLGLASTVSANPITWDVDSGSAICSGGVGNSCVFNENGHALMARAYSTTNNSGSGVFEKATLTAWSGGLGVKNPDQNNENSSPHHALDDDGRDELIVFENSDPGFSFTGFEIGWRHNDSDLSVWIGSLTAGYDFTGVRFSDLSGLGFTNSYYGNVPINTLNSLDQVPGNYLIIAPASDSNSEYVKISQISGELPNRVSEPNILMLFVISWLSLWISRKRIVAGNAVCSL